MRRVTASALVFALTFAAPLFAARAPRGGQVQGLASIAGVATSSTGQPIANVKVQLRDLATGSLAGTTTSSATGTFTFAGLQGGSYAVEVVNAAGQIIATSSSIAVSAGATITGLTVSATAASVAGAAGATGAAAAAGAGAGAVGASTAIVITTVAAAAGIAGAVAATAQLASPSR